jgi:2-polyprenyl-6-hydroxyphenyl methylase / 3-demethylubiquinone-9 3-methyltransferase
MTSLVNNEVYQHLGARWYQAKDDPIALLRAESRFRNPWVAEALSENHAKTVLDIGCGGGFLANDLAERGFEVTGVDQSEDALTIASQYDRTGSVRYVHSDAYALPFSEASFDAVAAMDFLEHVEEPGRLIAEAARVLRPGGLFFFYTFNRNPLSHLVVIKGVEWFVKNTPKDLHIIRLFIRPQELCRYLEAASLEVQMLRGTRPNVFSRAFLQMLFTGRVPDDFAFSFCQSKLMSYAGYARKNQP